MRARINCEAVVFAPRRSSRHRIDARHLVDLIAEKLDAHGVVFVRRPKFQYIAAHAERAARKVVRRALVLHFSELAEIVRHRLLRSTLEKEQHAEIEIGIADAVDTRHRRDDDHVAPLEYCFRRREPQFVDLVVLGHLLFDVEIGLRDVRLGLVVVVVRNEILDGVFGKEVSELLIELRGERFVVTENERRAIDRFNYFCDRERLSRSGDAEENLMPRSGPNAFDELADGLGLIALRLERRDEFEVHYFGADGAPALAGPRTRSLPCNPPPAEAAAPLGAGGPFASCAALVILAASCGVIF